MATPTNDWSFNRTYTLDLRARKLPNGGHSAHLTVPLRNGQSIGFGVCIPPGMVEAVKDFMMHALRVSHDVLHHEMAAREQAMKSFQPSSISSSSIVDSAPVEGFMLRRARNRGDVGYVGYASDGTGDYVGGYGFAQHMNKVMRNARAVQRPMLRGLHQMGRARMGRVGCNVPDMVEGSTGAYVGYASDGTGDYVGCIGDQVLCAVAPVVTSALPSQAAGLGLSLGSALGEVSGLEEILAAANSPQGQRAIQGVNALYRGASGQASAEETAREAGRVFLGEAGAGLVDRANQAAAFGAGVTESDAARKARIAALGITIAPGPAGVFATARARDGAVIRTFTTEAEARAWDPSRELEAAAAARAAEQNQLAPFGMKMTMAPISEATRQAMVPQLVATPVVSAGIAQGALPAGYLAGGELLGQALNALMNTPSLRSQIDPAIARTIANALRAMEVTAGAHLSDARAKQILSNARQQTANELTRALDMVNLIISP